METFVLLLLAGGLLLALLWWRRESAARRERELDDARAEARRWYERLGGQVLNLSGDQPAVRQALADAGERYNAAGSQLEQARSVYQFRLAQETAVEGLLYARAARVAMGLDPGPELPRLAAARGAGELTGPREVEVEGRTYRAGPDPGDDTPYYYPGGRVRGQRVPAGWYSQPLWRPALAGAAGAVGAMMVMNALLPPAVTVVDADQGSVDGFGEPGAGVGEAGTETAGDFDGGFGADFGGFDGGFDL
jgi:hypothetical protein